MKIPIIGRPLEYTLKLAGLWPDKFNIVGPILVVSGFLTILPFQCWDAIRYLDDPVMLMDDLSDILPVILLYVKFSIIWFNKRFEVAHLQHDSLPLLMHNILRLL